MGISSIFGTLILHMADLCLPTQLQGGGKANYKSDATFKQVHSMLQRLWDARPLAAAAALAEATAAAERGKKREVGSQQQQQLEDARQAAAALAAATSMEPKELLKVGGVYREMYSRCQDMFKIHRGQPLPAGLDPQDNSQQATFTRDELIKICDELLGSEDPLDARDLSMILAMCLMCGRGDDARERRLCELTEPMQRTCIGECLWPHLVVAGSW